MLHFAIQISILLQVFSAIYAINLTKSAKYTISWIMLTVALMFMAGRRVLELAGLAFGEHVELINSWVGVATSIAITIAIIYMKRIFKMIRDAEISRKISERKVLQAIINTEEKERKRFAKDLHDGLGPLLSSVKMSVSALSQIKKEDQKNEIINNTEMVINEAINSLKAISNNLSPHILDNFGMVSAVKSFITSIESTGKIKFNFHSNAEKIRFDSHTEVILYRVICELINNTISHSKAKLIKIEMILDDKILRIEYSDNGKGADMEMIHKTSRGMGIPNILSRIQSLNGEIKFGNKNGFQAIIKCPVNYQYL